MSAIKNRVLIFGAGVIGSIYAIKFIEAGIDVTLFARSNRLKDLRENGILYNEKGVVKSLKVNVIGALENDDIYDFIFVPVRYDQAESALLTLKDNQSKTIVTMTNNSAGFSSWLDIIGDRLLPAFPGAGGQIKDGVLYARIPPKALLSTRFGEISGLETERTRNLVRLLEAANFSSKIDNDMQAFLITHSVSDIAMTGILVQDDKIIDEETLRSRKTAQKIRTTLKKYLASLQKAGININPALFKVMLKCPNFILDTFFVLWLRSKMVKDMLAPDFAYAAHRENAQLERDLLDIFASLSYA